MKARYIYEYCTCTVYSKTYDYAYYAWNTKFSNGKKIIRKFK